MSEASPPGDVLDSLPFRGRLLVRRLESFGDIGVGFSISQLALQLGLPKTALDLTTNPMRYVLFFGTFAVIALAWMRFHRMLTMGFAPGRIDVACAFGYLAFTALLPYALYANVQLARAGNGARYGLAAYAICLIGSSATAFAISYRALLRGRSGLSELDVGRVRQRTWIEGGIVVIFATVLVSDLIFGPRWSWVFTFLIPVLTRSVRSRIKVPGWDALHVDGTGE